MSLQDAIEAFKSQVPSFISTDIVDTSSGMSIGGASANPDFDGSAASASFAEVVKANARALDLVGLGSDSTEDILITTKDAFLLLRVLGNHFHGLAVGKDANLGLARVLMKKHEKNILAEIEKLYQ